MVAGLKGGISKSTILGSVACHLAQPNTKTQHNCKILIVDADSQPSVTSFLLSSSVARGLDPNSTIYAIHAGQEPYPESVIHPTEFGIDLLPGHRSAARFNTPEPYAAPLDVQLRLRTFLDDVRDKYQYIFIDSAPSLSMTTWVGLVSADYYFVPTQSEDYSSMTVVDVLETAARVISGPNPNLNLLGIIISMTFPRRSLHQLYDAKSGICMGLRSFTTTIPHLVDFAEAISSRKPVTVHKPRGAAAKSIRALTAEMLTRIQSIESNNLVEESWGS